MNGIRMLLSATLFAIGTWAAAQTPKWFKKARKAQLTVAAYDGQGHLLQTGNGFFIDTDGTALAGYDLLKGAASATVVDAAGQTAEVECILGASALYNIVKFRVNAPKNVQALVPASANGLRGETVYVLPYPTQSTADGRADTLTAVDTFGDGYPYYTLTGTPDPKKEGCPVLNEAGEVLGLLQMPAKTGEQRTFAVGLPYAQSLCTQALSGSHDDLQGIGIKKALPADEEQAATFVLLASMQNEEQALTYMDDFIRHFPGNVNGYVMKAEALMTRKRYEEADETYRNGLAMDQRTDELHYSLGKMIYRELKQTPEPTVYNDWTMERALSEAEAASRINPLPLYEALQANCLYALKRYEEAATHYLHLQQTNMRAMENFLYAAQSLRMAGADTQQTLALNDSAVACFTKPYVKEAYLPLIMRAKARCEVGMWREAVADMYDVEHLMRNEISANFYYEREQAEMQCRMFQQALDDIQRAASMEPQEALYRAEEATVHYRVGQLKEAIAAAREAVRLDGNFADAHRILGVCLIENKEQAEGMVHLQKAVELGDTAAREVLEKMAPRP